MTPQERKAELRQSMVARILALDPLDREEQERSLMARFPTLPGLASADTVLLYVKAFPEEINTFPLLNWVIEQGKRLVCPRVERKERRLRLFVTNDPRRDLIPGRLGIPEPSPNCPEVSPSEVDWVLVPGLAFDRDGYRLGRGAGYYDRLLPSLRPEVPRIALILTPQWVEQLPVEPHDQPVHGVADPHQLVLW